MDEARLREKLAAIEALFAGATTAGERVAAGEARQRIQARLAEAARQEPVVEHRFSVPDNWSLRVMAALLRRYGLEPYRYRGQRRTTVVVKAPRRFIDETFWPEYEQIEAALRAHLNDITQRIVSEMIHGDESEAKEMTTPAQLAPGDAVGR